MKTVVDDYLARLSGPERSVIEHMYSIVRQTVPDTTEEVSYAMPAFKYNGQGLVAIMANKQFMSLYPFCAIDKLGVDVSGFEHTTGSIHFNIDKPISDELLRQIISARIGQIDQVSD